MPKGVSLSDARTQLPELLNRVNYAKERFIFEKHGKPFAALVPVDDLAALEAYEAERDARQLQQAVQTSKGTVPLSKVIDEYQKKHGIFLKDIEDGEERQPTKK